MAATRLKKSLTDGAVRFHRRGKMRMEKESRKGKVLVVDDAPSSIDTVEAALESEGYEVIVATSGEKAVGMAESAAPHLILLDVLMPGIDGFETCRRLKTADRTKEIPVIFMTGLTDTESRVTGFELGGVDYVTKPIEIEEFLARIRTHLALRNVRRELEAQNARLRQEVRRREWVQEALKESKENYKMLVENLPSIV